MLPILEDQYSLPKRKRKTKEKEKEKKKKIKSLSFVLKPEHGPRGVWRKPLKPGALSLNWLGVIDLVFVTWVDRESLTNFRCLIFEVIRSPG